MRPFGRRRTDVESPPAEASADAVGGQGADRGWVYHDAGPRGRGYTGWLYVYADGAMASEDGTLYEYDSSGAAVLSEVEAGDGADPGWVYHEAREDGTGYTGWLYQFADGALATEDGSLYEYDASGAAVPAALPPSAAPAGGIAGRAESGAQPEPAASAEPESRPAPEAAGRAESRPEPEAAGGRAESRPEPEAAGGRAQSRPEPEAAGGRAQSRPEPQPAAKTTRSRSTAKKTTAKKTTAKKTTAKKSTATKSTATKTAAKKSTAKKSTPRKTTTTPTRATPTPEPVVAAETPPEVDPEAAVEAEPTTVDSPAPAAEAAPAAPAPEATPEPEPEVDIDAEPQPEAEAEPTPETDTTPDRATSKPAVAPVPAPPSEPEPTAEAEPEPTSEPAAAGRAESAPEPAAEHEPEPLLEEEPEGALEDEPAWVVAYEPEGERENVRMSALLRLPDETEQERSPVRARILVLALAVLGIAALLGALAVQWSDDDPVPAAGGKVRFAPPNAVPVNSEYVRVRALSTGELEVDHWIRSGRPLSDLTLRIPKTSPLGAPVRPMAEKVRVETAEQVLTGSDAGGPRNDTFAFPGTDTLHVRYLLSGVANTSATNRGRAVLEATSLDLAYTYDQVPKTVMITGGVIRQAACLVQGSSAEAISCGTEEGRGWRVRLEAPERRDLVLVTLDLP